MSSVAEEISTVRDDISETAGSVTDSASDSSVLYQRLVQFRRNKNDPERLTIVGRKDASESFRPMKYVAKDFIFYDGGTKLSEIVQRFVKIEMEQTQLNDKLSSIGSHVIENARAMSKIEEIRQEDAKDLGAKIDVAYGSLSDLLEKQVTDCSRRMDDLFHRMKETEEIVENARTDAGQIDSLIDAHVQSRLSTFKEQIERGETEKMLKMEKMEYVLTNFMNTFESYRRDVDDRFTKMVTEERCRDMIYEQNAKMESEIRALSVNNTRDLLGHEKRLQEVDANMSEMHANMLRMECNIGLINEKFDNQKVKTMAAIASLNESQTTLNEVVMPAVKNFASCQTTLNEVVVPAIKGLAVDVKICINGLDTLVEEVNNKITQCKSDTLCNFTEIKDIKYKLENMEGNIAKINEIIKDVVICYD